MGCAGPRIRWPNATVGPVGRLGPTRDLGNTRVVVSLTGHIYWPELWLANLDWYDGLSDEDRALVDEVAL